MDVFLARLHVPMTHLPIASAILAALASLAAIIFAKYREKLSWAWAVLSLVAVISVVPTIITGIEAGRGRTYIEEGIIVADLEENANIRLHQQLGFAGFGVSLILAGLGIARLRGKNPNPYLVASIAVILVTVWLLGAHEGGAGIWAPDTFPGFKKELIN